MRFFFFFFFGGGGGGGLCLVQGFFWALLEALGIFLGLDFLFPKKLRTISYGKTRKYSASGLKRKGNLATILLFKR